ncbi:tRNA (guanine(9)-N(1))-methyltransferase [Pleurotus pulmonarius]|nr:tRNA (guanine(9)-N(1))-methyltransferase [Pleurotus pulmonarius]
MPDNTAPPTALSKNALKKQAKAERYAANKLERRAREKEARKEKKRLHALKRAAGELDDEDDKRASKKQRVVTDFKGKVVLDLGFDDKMNEKEIVSLTSQLAYTYSANRHAMYPFSLFFSSLNGRTLARLESLNDAGYKRWTKTEWWQEGYDKLWGDGVTEQSNVVYLTADADYELLELKEDETYIIGGICDHNRYKNLCLNKAKESGVRAARLPIGRYLAQMPTRKVLTVNQVMEILIKWAETKDWEQALYAVVPKRKFRTNEPEAEEDDGKEGHEGDDDGKHPPIADTKNEALIAKAVD